MGVKRARQSSVSSSEDPSTPYPYSREQSADVKIVHLDAETAISDKSAIMRCSLPPHQPLAFDSIEDYEVHYHKTHVNRCSDCQNNFPDEHFLHLHIAENHDPINAAKRERGEKTYGCLVADCDRLCSTPQKRRLHCIDKHQFPRNYDFFTVNYGIDRRSSMLRRDHRRRSSTMGSSQGNSSDPSRRRGESFASTGEGMEIVKDGEEEGGQDESDEQEQAGEVRREPVRLRGRGGFGHPQAGCGRGRGRGHGRSLEVATLPSKPVPATADPADAMESLASRMSALQFVPHSVRTAQGRGQERGG